MLKKRIIYGVHVLIYLFALIGFILTGGYVAIRLHLTNAVGVIDMQNEVFKKSANEKNMGGNGQYTVDIPLDLAWSKTSEWKTFKQAVTKDAPQVEQVSKITSVDRRLIIAQLAVEQLRLFTDEREIYKQMFAPLKILGSQSQFSWGIMGLKEDTAKQIEQNLKDSSSPFYLGLSYEHLLDFKTADHNTERFERIIDEHNHYYDYLYVATYLKEITTQWKNAGYDISNRPEILSTLYNIGFIHSVPNPNPSVGGAEIDVGGSTYSFGSLAYQFYYSDELNLEFPQGVAK